MKDLVITSSRVATAEAVGPASIHIRGERIAAIAGPRDLPAGCELVDAGDSVVMAGLVDTHVHVNEPGRTEWEGFATATRAAAAGGVTTIVDMPLNSIPPTTTLAGFETKLAAARNECHVDVAFWGGVVPGNASQLAPLIDAGVRGFKCFLIDSGVDEFPRVDEADLAAALVEIAALDAPLLVHAELPGPIEVAAGGLASGDPCSYHTFLASRPRAAENDAIALMMRLARETGARIHIVHHSSSDALPMIEEAKAAGARVTVETCPHYLALAAEDVPARATQFKCCPPVRERENREKLWQALARGTIDMIVSDHSPCEPQLKRLESGDFLEAWGGIASLQFGLPVVWTEARRRGFTLSHLTEWMSLGPARLAGLEKRKGEIKPGYDADLVIWNPEASFTVRRDIIRHKHKLTPYDGARLEGVVEAVYLRGRKIFDGTQEEAFVNAPGGALLL